MTLIKKLINEAEKQGPTPEDIKLLKSELKRYILTKKPRSLSGGHDADWFLLNDRNQLVWNWRNKEYPLILLIDLLNDKHPGLKARMLNGKEYNRYNDIVNAVLNSREVKAFKETYRAGTSDKQVVNMKAELVRIGHEMARLDARKKELQAKLEGK